MKLIAKNPLFTLGLIILLGFIIRLLWFTGHSGGDDMGYIARAFAYAQGDFSPPQTHWGTRLFPILLTALSIKVWGIGNLAISFFPLVFSIAGILLAYFIAKQLFDHSTGLIAALLVATFPMEILFSTQLYPYIFLGTLTALSFYLFIRSEEQNSGALLYWSGVALGLAYTSRITALYCLLFFGLYVLWKRKFPLRYLYFIAGLLSIFFLESMFYYIIADDPLHRFNVILNIQSSHSAGTSGAAKEFAALTPEQKSQSLLLWVLEPFFRPIFEQELGFTFLLLWPIIIYTLFQKNAATALLLLWIIPIFLYISFGTTSPINYLPLRRLPRYLSVIVIPCLILIAWYIAKLENQFWKTALLISIMSANGIALLLDNSQDVSYREKAVARFIQDNPSEHYVLSRKIYFNVNYYLNFEPQDNLSLFAVPKSETDKLIFIQSVHPDVVWHKAMPCGKILFSREAEIARNFKHDEFQVLKSFTDKESIYQRLVTNELILQALSLIRDPKRMHVLSKRNAKNIVMGSVACS